MKENVPSNTKSMDYAMDEYKIIWDYYKHTLHERENSYNRYFKVIALPATVIGGFATVSDSLPLLDMGKVILFTSFFMFVIAIVGLSIYITYVYEMISSERYLRLIGEMRTQFVEKDRALSNFFTGVYSNNENSKNSKKKLISLGKTKLSRSMAMPLINSSLIPFALYLHNFLNLFFSILAYVIIFALHILILIVIQKNAFKARVESLHHPTPPRHTANTPVAADSLVAAASHPPAPALQSGRRG